MPKQSVHTDKQTIHIDKLRHTASYRCSQREDNRCDNLHWPCCVILCHSLNLQKSVDGSNHFRMSKKRALSNLGRRNCQNKEAKCETRINSSESRDQSGCTAVRPRSCLGLEWRKNTKTHQNLQLPSES